METRRGFLRKGLLGGVLLLLGGSAVLLLRGTRRRQVPRGPLFVLTPDEYAVFAAVAARVVAVDGDSPSTDEVDVAGRADAAMALWSDAAQVDFRRLVRLFENALNGAATRTGFDTFTASAADRQDARLRAWELSRVGLFRTGYQAMKRLADACYYAAPATWAATGYPGPPELPFGEPE